jgi:hypothetical protein
MSSSKSRVSLKERKKVEKDDMKGVKMIIEKPQAIAFELDSKPIKEPKRKRANVVIPEGQDLEKALKNDLNKRVNNFNAEDYKKYKGKRDPNLNLEDQRD